MGGIISLLSFLSSQKKWTREEQLTLGQEWGLGAATRQGYAGGGSPRCRTMTLSLPREAAVFAVWCCDRDEAICLALGWALLSTEKNEHLQDMIHLPCFRCLLQMRWNHPEMSVSLHWLWRELRATLTHRHLHYQTAVGAQKKPSPP